MNSTTQDETNKHKLKPMTPMEWQELRMKRALEFWQNAANRYFYGK